jgi:hypothetical protein
MENIYALLFTQLLFLLSQTALFVFVSTHHSEIKKLQIKDKTNEERLQDMNWSVRVFRENVQISDIKIQQVLQYQERLAEKLHTNIICMQEMINKTQCETVVINDRIHITKRELEEKIAGLIKMQEKVVLYIQDNIHELKMIYKPMITGPIDSS